MKGIILAGGKGTRLYPITVGISKQMLSVYDKPMIYYPVSVLLNAGIKEILIISTPQDISAYKRLLGNGSEIGVSFSYIIQNKPEGIAHAFILAEEFIGRNNVCLILGDNIFYGNGLTNLLKQSIEDLNKNSCSVFGYYVKDPNRYGVVEFNSDSKVISIEEKPIEPKSNFAVVGLYFYTNDVIEITKSLTPSKRGELEITSVNKEYLKKNKLNVKIMDKGYVWLDTGTVDSLLEANNFIQTIQKRQGLKVGCIHEIAYRNGYIDRDKFSSIIEKFISTNYGIYLKEILENENN